MLEMKTSQSGNGQIFASANRHATDEFRRRLDALIKSAGHTTMTITPAQAEIMLERNTGNRPINKNSVKKWAEEMRKGAWKLTGETIIFAKDGTLNNGQHRLMGCVQSGCPFRTDVRFGIERDAFQVTDVGQKRTLAHVLGINGEKNVTVLAGAVSWMYRHIGGGHGFGKDFPTTTQGIELHASHPRLAESVDVGRRVAALTGLIAPSLASFLHYSFAQRDRDLADNFFEAIETGLGLTGASDPRYLFRARLIENKGAKAKLPDVYIAALAIKAWNAVRAGRQLKTLRWTNDPAARGTEAFPEIE